MNSMLQKVSTVVGVRGVGDVFSKAAVSVAVPKMTAVAGTNRIYAGVGNGVSHQFGSHSLQHLHGGEAAMVQFLLGGDNDGATGDSLISHGIDPNNNGNDSEVTVVLSTVQDGGMRDPVAATAREPASTPADVKEEDGKKPFGSEKPPAAEAQPPVEEGRRTRSASEKYSLRPRSIQNRIETEMRRRGGRSAADRAVRSGAAAAASNEDGGREGTTGSAAGSGGRSGGGSGGGRREPKPKQKPPPLSKYRRKTANARERSRMREINQAFETLRKAVPTYPTPMSCSSSSSSSSCSSSSGSPSYGSQNKASEKLTKITTLRLAMNYIEALAQILREKPREDDTGLLSPSSTSSIASSLSSASSSSPYLHQQHHHHHPYRQEVQPQGMQAPLPPLIQLPSLLPPMPPLPLGSHLGGFSSHQLTGSTFGEASSGCGSDELGDYTTTCSDLLSDDGSTFGGGGRGGAVGTHDDPLNVDSFDDIIGDGLDILLESDGESLQFHSDLSEQSTP
ncbi:uncharacterized protein [Hetaerina americana]|uniref:uncharacterized protein n=1 Tax=Hetaerina americana TaxID=62018 RepID=UPI003A7F5CE5